MKVALLMRDNPLLFRNGLARFHRELTPELQKLGIKVEWAVGGTDKGTLDLGSKLPDCDLAYVTSLPYGAKVKVPMVAKCNSPVSEEMKYYGLVNRVKAWLAVGLEARTLAKALAVVAVSETTKELLEQDPYFCIRSTVIPDGVDPEAFAPGTKLQMVTWSGRLEKRKNPNLAKRLLAGLPDDWRPNVCSGDIDEDQYRRVVNQTAIFLSTSFSEGFDQALLQAMSSGCACLASDIPAHRELLGLSASENLELFADEKDAREKLAYLVNDRQVRDWLGQVNRVVARRLTWGRTAKFTKAVFDSSLRVPEAHLAA